MNTCVHGQRIGGCSICWRRSPRVLLAVDDSPAPTYADVLTRERDAYKAQVASLRADLARVTKERDALKAGRVLAPWGLVDGFVSFYRCCRGIRMAFVESRVGGPRGVFWGIYMAPHTIGYAPTVEAAKAAADATLVAAGWYLADEGGE